MITASRRSCGNFPCSQQQRKSSCLLWRVWPPCFQISAGMSSPPAALPLLSCLMALVVSSRVGSSSSSGLTVCWGMCRIAVSWTVRFALKRAWKCSDQRSKIDALSAGFFQRGRSTNCSGFLWECAEGCCMHDGKQLSSLDMMAANSGPGGQIAFLPTVLGSQHHFRQTSLYFSFWWIL